MADDYDAIGPVNAFGDELRAWRQQRGLRIADLTDSLHLSTAMIGAMERGNRAATRMTAKLCDEAFDTPGTFERLWRRQAKHAVPSQNSPYYDLEAQATRIHKWELRCLPGLVQVESYARAIMQTDLLRDADDELEENVKQRIDRQGILTRDDSPLVWLILDESVLRRPYGNMQEQLRHLAMLANRNNIIIQILPHDMNDHPGLNGPLTILEFADSPPIDSAQGCESGRLTENTQDVAHYLACYNLICASALSRATSLAMINQAGGLR